MSTRMQYLGTFLSQQFCTVARSSTAPPDAMLHRARGSATSLHVHPVHYTRGVLASSQLHSSIRACVALTPFLQHVHSSVFNVRDVKLLHILRHSNLILRYNLRY